MRLIHPSIARNHGLSALNRGSADEIEIRFAQPADFPRWTG